MLFSRLVDSWMAMTVDPRVSRHGRAVDLDMWRPSCALVTDVSRPTAIYNFNTYLLPRLYS